MVALLGLAGGARADILAYASGQTSNTTSSFGVLDLTTGSFSSIATLNNIFVNDLALGPNGTLYLIDGPFTTGSGVAEFATINPASGAITNIAPNTVDLNSIDFSDNGTLYGTTYTGTGPEALYSINSATGAASFISDLTGPLATTASQLRFIGNTAYTTSFTPPSDLYTIDLATGAGTPVGNTGLNQQNGLGGAAGGELLDIAATNPGAEVVSIDPTTGAATAGPSVGRFYVFSLIATPEPGSATLVGGALAGLVAFRRRRKRFVSWRHMSLRLMVAVAVFLGSTFADVLVVPNANTSTTGNDSSGSLAGPIGGLEFQQVFGSGQFSSVPGNLLITQLAFREEPGTGSIAATATSFDLFMSTTTYSPNSLPGNTLITTNFAANRGPDNTMVLSSGPGTLWGSSGCTGAGPCPFDMVFTFNTPFLYNPSRGNLLFDFQVTGYNGVGTGQFDVENFGRTGGAVASVSGMLGSPTGQVFDSFGNISGNITQFGFTVVTTPEPSTLSYIALALMVLPIARVKHSSARLRCEKHGQTRSSS